MCRKQYQELKINESINDKLFPVDVQGTKPLIVYRLKLADVSGSMKLAKIRVTFWPEKQNIVLMRIAGRISAP